MRVHVLNNDLETPHVLRTYAESRVWLAVQRAADRPSRHKGTTSSPYAVVVLPSGARPRLSLIPWLRTRYGIEQVHTVSLAWPEWDALVAGDIDSPHLKRFKDRLALAQLCRPEAVVVVGGAVPQPSRDERPQARREVERVVSQIRAWGMPLEVIGVWVNEHWGADDCLIESEELPLPARTDGPRESESDEEQYAGLTSD
jgi:hypothetical protein